MSEVYPIDPVVRFCGITARLDSSRRWAIRRLASDWGDVIVRSPALPMDAGGYYRDEMGDGLLQELVAFGGPTDPAGLADWKHACNDLEKQAKHLDPDVKRPINLDCGYITQAKFVLATTKNRSHRIYLRRAMFAEITLTYVGGKWQAGPQTYPNYRTAEVAHFATDCRNQLRQWIHREDRPVFGAE